MDTRRRRFKLDIWWLAAAYFAFYAPYAALIKLITGGFLLSPNSEQTVSGFQILPASLVATVFTMGGIITAKGWWKYAGRRRVCGREVPVPRPHAVLSGVGAAIIITTTTLAYTFQGVSILLTLLLLRSGVLILGPLVDLTFKRRVRWFSYAALALSMAAVLSALADVGNYRLTFAAVLNLAAYQFGYLLRLSCMTTAAKSDDVDVTRRYFVEEQLAALPLLLAASAVIAVVSAAMPESSAGLSAPWASGVAIPALLVGTLYGCLYVFGTLIYLDRRENSFCVPLNRCSSILSGVLASFALAGVYGMEMPGVSQLTGAALMLFALAFLSPLHHAELSLRKLKDALKATRAAAGAFFRGRAWSASPGAGGSPERAEHLRGLLLFVCSGNTCRSPMAEAIAQAELAARTPRRPESLAGAILPRASSAGLSVRPGASMTVEAQHALHDLGVQAAPHIARPLTAELAARADRIFCMTGAHRTAVIDMIPAATRKTHCLDPDGDIEDPAGHGREVYAACALRLQNLIRLRLAEFELRADLQ